MTENDGELEYSIQSDKKYLKYNNSFADVMRKSDKSRSKLKPRHLYINGGSVQTKIE
jgi:hypothetical protein